MKSVEKVNNLSKGFLQKTDQLKKMTPVQTLKPVNFKGKSSSTDSETDSEEASTPLVKKAINVASPAVCISKTVVGRKQPIPPKESSSEAESDSDSDSNCKVIKSLEKVNLSNCLLQKPDQLKKMTPVQLSKSVGLKKKSSSSDSESDSEDPSRPFKKSINVTSPALCISKGVVGRKQTIPSQESSSDTESNSDTDCKSKKPVVKVPTQSLNHSSYAKKNLSKQLNQIDSPTESQSSDSQEVNKVSGQKSTDLACPVVHSSKTTPLYSQHRDIFPPLELSDSVDTKRRLDKKLFKSFGPAASGYKEDMSSKQHLLHQDTYDIKSGCASGSKATKPVDKVKSSSNPFLQSNSHVNLAM
ncbi:unnamed protein product, partial [Protopolystoma xenopodis]